MPAKKKSVDWPRTLRDAGAGDYRHILTALYELAGRGAAVDLGCGEAHVTKEWLMCTLIDMVLRPAIIAAGRSIDMMDMRKAPELFVRERRRFNLALLSDSIEHLTKEDGTKLLEELAPMTNATVVFAPVGPWQVDPLSTNPDAHKSEWWPSDFHKQGWGVWEFPTYHRFGAKPLGAFWAWRFRDSQPTWEQVAAKAGVSA